MYLSVILQSNRHKVKRIAETGFQVSICIPAVNTACAAALACEHLMGVGVEMADAALMYLSAITSTFRPATAKTGSKIMAAALLTWGTCVVHAQGRCCKHAAMQSV